jgi:hypothetical protein
VPRSTEKEIFFMKGESEKCMVCNVGPQITDGFRMEPAHPSRLLY